MPPSTSPDKALTAILPLIAAGSAYEAHQKARTFASRYVKANAYDTAIQVLFQSARELLKTGHAGSGSDLALFLIDVYVAKDQEVDDTARDNLTQLIALTGSQGVWRKTVIDKAIGWSSTYGESPLGDSKLRQYIGELLYKEGVFDQAEIHFLAAGNRDSARSLAIMMSRWLPANGSPAEFAVRGVLPYMLTQNILAARTFLEEYISQIRRSRPSILIQPNPILLPSKSGFSESGDEMLVTSDPTINFLQLAIRTCQRGSGDSQEHQRDARNTWIRIVSRYKGKSTVVASAPMVQACANLGHTYFGIPLPRAPGNPLQDMMASLFGGAPGGGGGTPARGAIRGGRGRGGAPRLD